MDFFSGWCKSARRLDGAVAVVTGCNTGIGKETVADFYKRGAKVIMACRDINKADIAKNEIEQASPQKNGTLVVEQLDTSSLDSVRRFAERVLAREEKLDILVNNAGVMMCPRGASEDGFETHIATNHLGHAMLTLLLLPVMMTSEAARIVVVSSYLHALHDIDLDDMDFEKSNYDPLVAYSRSKSANILFAKALAVELKKRNITNVTTYSLHPGVVGTDIGRNFHESVGWGTTWLFRHVLSWFVKSVRCGAQTTIYCALDEGCAGESGLYYRDCAVSTPSKQCLDDEFAFKFWNWTLKTLNIENSELFQK